MDYEFILLNNVSKVSADNYISNIKPKQFTYLTSQASKDNAKIKTEIVLLLVSNNDFISKAQISEIQDLLILNNDDVVMDKLLNNDNFVNRLDYDKLNALLHYGNNPEKIFDKIGDKVIEIINNTESNPAYDASYNLAKLSQLYASSSNPLKTLKYILNKTNIDIKELLKLINGFRLKYTLNKLNEKDREEFIDIILENSSTWLNMGKMEGIFFTIIQNTLYPEKIITKTGEIGKKLLLRRMENNFDDTMGILKLVKKPIKTLNALGDETKKMFYEQTIRAINDPSLYNLIQNTLYEAKNPDELIYMYLSNIKLKSNLDTWDITGMLAHCDQPKKVIKLLGNDTIKYLKSNLTRRDFIYTMSYGKNPVEFINLLGSVGKKFIKQLSLDSVASFLGYKSNEQKEQIKNIISALGDKGTEFIEALGNNKEFFQEFLLDIRYPNILITLIGEDKTERLVKSISTEEAYDIYKESTDKEYLADFLQNYGFPDFRY